MKGILIFALTILSTICLAAEGYPIKLKKGVGGNFFSMLGLDGLGGLFLTAAAIIALVSALKAFAVDNNGKAALWRLFISLIIIGILAATWS